MWPRATGFRQFFGRASVKRVFSVRVPPLSDNQSSFPGALSSKTRTSPTTEQLLIPPTKHEHTGSHALRVRRVMFTQGRHRSWIQTNSKIFDSIFVFWRKPNIH
jgi:hypothetical protein